MKSIALLGCGQWGRNILSVLVGKQCRVVVIDPDTASHQDAKAIGASACYQTLDTSMAVDALFIASPTTTHADVLEQLLPLKIPTFVEKPLTAGLEDFRRIKPLLHEQVFPMHVWLYHPAIIQLRGLIKDKLLGELVAVHSWRANWTSPRKDTNTLWNLMPHDLSIVDFLLGYIPKFSNISSEVYQGQIRAVLTSTTSHPLISIHVSNRFERKTRLLRLHFSQGTAEVDFINRTELTISYGGTESETPKQESLQIDNTPALNRQIDHILAYLDGKQPPIENLAQAEAIITSINEMEKQLEKQTSF